MKTVTYVESYVKISRCVENVYVRRVENHIENRVEVRKKTPSHFTARVKIERQISFFYFGFARVTEVGHILKKIVLKSAHNEHLDTFMNTFASTFINILMGLFTL